MGFVEAEAGVVVYPALEAEPVAFVVGQIAAAFEAYAQSVEGHCAFRRSVRCVNLGLPLFYSNRTIIPFQDA